MSRHSLGPLLDIEDGTAKGFELDPDTPILVLRQGDRAYAYVNRCPHIGVQLNWMPDQFMSLDQQWLQCSMHGAQFRLHDGLCIYGPCLGRSLESLALTIEDGQLWVEATLSC